MFQIFLLALVLLSSGASPTNKAMTGSTKSLEWKSFVPVSAKVGGHQVPVAAILLPVTARISNHVVHGLMQLDSGANTSILYGGTLRRIFGRRFAIAQDRFHQTSLRGTTGGHPFSLDDVFVEAALDEGDENSLPVIGTLGADLFRQNVVALDLQRNRFALTSSLKSLHFASIAVAKMNFTAKNHLNRMVVGMHAGKTRFHVFYDSGSSAFDAVLLAGPWKAVTGRSPNDAANVTVSVPSWGKTLSMVGAPSRQPLAIGPISLGRALVYQESTALRSVISPYDGLFGNAAFVGRGIVVIDAPDSLFGFVRTVR